MIDVNEEKFDEEVTNSAKPVVIDVWAEWCGPCRMYGPIIEEVSEEYKDRVKFVKIDADASPKLMERYNIMSIPTTMLIENGEVKAMNVGAISKDALRKWLSKNL